MLLDALLPLAEGSGAGHAVVLRAEAVRLDGTEGLNATPLPTPAAEVADLLAELPSGGSGAVRLAARPRA